jgi:ATP-dependent RNA helicase DeaD
MTEQTQAPLFDAAGNPVAPEAPTPSDYVALATFDELPLSEGTRAAIAAKGYTKPTPVQAAALAPILAGKDVIVRSKTGTGKTAAFGIPIAEVVDPSLPKVQAVVLCNTRELALQVATELGELAAGRDVRVTAIYGGASMGAQQKALDDGAQVIVGTPGRVIDLLERKVLSFAAVKLAVLDEADEMLGVGFLEDVMTILAKCPRGHQTALFSATLTPDIEKLIRKHLKEPQTILLSGDVYTVAGIRHVRYFARDAFPKPRNLLYMLALENPETAIVFCNTRDDVNLVCTVLNRHGYDADKLSGELSQTDRERVMAKIKRGEVRFMVATDLAARGIDISDLTHVVNYSLPEDPAVYLHRVGRTGRIGKTGTALSLVRGTELSTLSTLEKKFGIPFESKEMPTPEEAHRLWVDTHVAELRESVGTMLFDAYIPMAQELKAKEGSDVLIAFALKYFFTHHRHEKLAALRRDDEVRSEQQKKGESKERLQERRSERARPRLEPAAPKVEAPAAESQPRPAPQPRPKPEPKPNRLFVSIGSAEADEATLRTAIAGLAGAAPEAVLLVEQRPTHSYVEVAPDDVPAFLGANAKEWNGKALTVEVARPPSARRRRR